MLIVLISKFNFEKFYLNIFLKFSKKNFQKIFFSIFYILYLILRIENFFIFLKKFFVLANVCASKRVLANVCASKRVSSKRVC